MSYLRGFLVYEIGRVNGLMRFGLVCFGWEVDDSGSTGATINNVKVYSHTTSQCSKNKHSYYTVPRIQKDGNI